MAPEAPLVKAQAGCGCGAHHPGPGDPGRITPPPPPPPPQGLLFRLRQWLLWFLAFFGIYASSPVCPCCGTPGCPVGAGGAVVAGGVFTVLWHYGARLWQAASGRVRRWGRGSP